MFPILFARLRDIGVAVSVALMVQAGAADAVEIPSHVTGFLNRYCCQCHGAQQQKGDRRFDELGQKLESDSDLVDVQEILDQLNLGDMPPEEAVQPSAEQRRRAVAALTESIEEYHQSREVANRQVVLRRLNAREYRNTIRDLLALNTTIYDPTESFPRDQTQEHLDNVGQSLVMSSHLLSANLNAADKVIEKALFPVDRPIEKTWVFRDGFRQQPEIDQVHRKTNGFQHLTLYDVIGADKHEGAYAPILAFQDGVPYDGWYEIRILAEAVNRLHPYDDDFLGRDRSQPLRLGIRPGDRNVGALHLPQPNEPLLDEIVLKDGRDWYTSKVWLDEGLTPRFTFRNGLMDARNLWTRLIRKYPEGFPKGQKGIVAMRFNAIKFGKLPHIRIHEVHIRGPLYDQWPRESQVRLLGNRWSDFANGKRLAGAEVADCMRRFASRAYRRPANDDEVQRLVALVTHQRAAGRTEQQALADGFRAALCSPSFLYLDEGEKEQLDRHALATRLSYFLWSSTPDVSMVSNSSASHDDPSWLRTQARRMLQDEKSDAFVDGFLDSWLTLRDLGSAPPDRGAFRAFYQYDLQSAMRMETHRFTRHLLDENLSVDQFLDSDFTFVNEPLAKLYGILGPKGPKFQKVQLQDQRRGGLLGQASVLTVTANGIETSPVVRGVWVLENLLGSPPNPPPPDVEPLDPDVRGAKSIREQLEKHRSVSACNDCHRKIDPLGFALESFDPIGRWRNSYGKSPVETSGKLPSGERFEDVRGLKKILTQQRKEQFRRALVEKLLAYAVGRTLGPSDRVHVDKIVREMAQGKSGFRDLIEMIVLSPPFRQI